MSTTNSGKKIEAFNGIAFATTTFMTDVHENLKGLRVATEVIKLPIFDKIYNGVSSTINDFNDFAEDLSDSLHKMTMDYSTRKGFGDTSKIAFEDCATVANNIKADLKVSQEVQLSSGLDESVTDETVGSFVKELRNVLGARDTYLAYVATAVQENTEADTAEIYQNIGIGVEKITNGFARLFNEYSADLKAFQIDLEEITGSVKSASSTVADNGASTASKFESHEGGLL